MSISTNAAVTMACSVVLLGLTWVNLGIAAAPLGPQNLQAAPLVCAKGFVAQGTSNSYTCRSETFKCRANMQVLLKSLNGNRATYVCGFPEG